MSVRSTIEAVRAEGRAALLVYLPAGYPDLDTSVACLLAAAEAGADLLEVGFPFSDPIMDGPTIQAACQHALDAGYRVDDFLDVAAQVTTETEAPGLVMTYSTLAYARGLEEFAEAVAGSGLRGVILPDLPAVAADEWLAAARPAGLETVFLASSVSSDDRLAAIGRASSGFVYATGLLGVTGVKAVETRGTSDLVARVREHTDLPVCVGVGVSTAEQASEVAAYADGVIVGSAVVRAVGDGEASGAAGRVSELVAELRSGVELGRRD